MLLVLGRMLLVLGNHCFQWRAYRNHVIIFLGSLLRSICCCFFLFFLCRSGRAKMAKTEVDAPLAVSAQFRNLHPPADDDVVVDAAAALRTFFRVVDSIPANNLLRLHFSPQPRVCGKLFVATTALMGLLGNKNYDISESPNGVMYVATRSVDDAIMLDSQVHASLGVTVSGWPPFL